MLKPFMAGTGKSLGWRALTPCNLKTGKACNGFLSEAEDMNIPGGVLKG